MKAVLDTIITIGFTGIALWLFWKLMPSAWRFITGLGLILTFLYVVSQSLEAPSPSGALPPQGQTREAGADSLAPLPQITAAYSLDSRVEP